MEKCLISALLFPLPSLFGIENTEICVVAYHHRGKGESRAVWGVHHPLAGACPFTRQRSPRPDLCHGSSRAERSPIAGRLPGSIPARGATFLAWYFSWHNGHPVKGCRSMSAPKGLGESHDTDGTSVWNKKVEGVPFQPPKIEHPPGIPWGCFY